MSEKVLLLQGPMGPFFHRFAQDLEAHDFTTYKINFNTGDWLFYHRKNTLNYRGKLSNWPEFLRNKIKQWDIDRIYLFGDMRAYHRAAFDIAHELSIPIMVFEEGYLRPHYITLEEGGVNGMSSIPREPGFYKEQEEQVEKTPIPVPNAFLHAAVYSIIYYMASFLSRWWFPHYQHHRSFNPFYDGYAWLRSGYRKLHYQQKEKDLLKYLTTYYDRNYFLVPLQVHCDSQVRVWSAHSSVAAFIRRIIGAFSQFAPNDALLVIKHHPLDRGYTDYTQLIEKIAKRFNCQERVMYIHDLHLPTLLDHAAGTIVLNSTVGMSSLLHNTPVITLGDAIYNIPGISFRGGLKKFFTEPNGVDSQLNRKFRSYLQASNQINGSFYRKINLSQNKTGIINPQFDLYKTKFIQEAVPLHSTSAQTDSGTA